MPPKPLPGFRDFYPEQFAEREYIFTTWRRIVRRYAFVEYDGPPLEPLDLYTQKSGDEIVTQLYNFVDKGDRAVAMRPEMTPTFARMVGARAQALRKPVRWFSLPQLFRYERTQKGRLREHYQLNVDMVGESDLLADAELLSVAIEIMRAFGLSHADVRARVSDRQLLNGLLTHFGIAEGDWAARHDRYATPLHGRTKDGQVIPMSWHCEDAAINYSAVPAVTRAWHGIVAELRRKTDVFDDWGMFAYTSGSTGADYLTEIDIGIWEQRLDDKAWAMWVRAKREIAAASLAVGGSISACHGSCREGEVDLVPAELGRGFGVMLDIKRTLDPNNIMNPGKYLLDRAYPTAGQQVSR